jgi:hypothetical protein
MSEVLLVNPRRRRRKGRRKMSALQRKYFGGGKKSRRKNPKRRRRTRGSRRRSRRRSNPIAIFAPKRRKRRGKSRRARSRRRRNPAARSVSLGAGLGAFKPRNVQATLMNALPGAVGALGLDILLGYVPVPAQWKAGYLGYVTKAVGAIVLGLLASKVTKASTAAKMTEGALTVMFHGILRNAVTQFAPAVPMGMYLNDGGMGYYGSGWNPDTEYGDMAAYLPDISAESIVTDERDMGMYMENQGEYY